ncbi:MAG: hypothetical protein IKR66_05780 [Bacteroidales bacterium]|nr:hypothetical protein [Bacteroidales bacterium]
MRPFSETEKDVIRKLVNAENALCYILSTVYFDITSDIYVDNNGFVRTDSKDVNVTQKQIEITHITLFLHWLAENRYIWILSYELPELEPRKDVPHKYGSPFPIPPAIFKLYKQYQSCPVFISQELVNLVKDNFKTYEEKVLRTARWTLIVAIIAFVATTVIAIIK